MPKYAVKRIESFPWWALRKVFRNEALRSHTLNTSPLMISDSWLFVPFFLFKVPNITVPCHARPHLVHWEASSSPSFCQSSPLIRLRAVFTSGTFPFPRTLRRKTPTSPTNLRLPYSAQLHSNQHVRRQSFGTSILSTPTYEERTIPIFPRTSVPCFAQRCSPPFPPSEGTYRHEPLRACP